MNCPTCNSAMVTLELADVEIDHCVTCGGIWLDAGELELLLDDPEKARCLLDSFRASPAAAEALRRCPICAKKMAKIAVGPPDRPLLVDTCRRGDGLWLDKGELRDLLERGEWDEDSRIQRLLADMFGRGTPERGTGSES
jgi:Zn-finger nucleic acid-binding protein